MSPELPLHSLLLKANSDSLFVLDSNISVNMPAPSGTNDDNILFETGQSETARLALQHEIIKYGMKGLIKAPIDLSKPGLKILDQATADGK